MKFGTKRKMRHYLEHYSVLSEASSLLSAVEV